MYSDESGRPAPILERARPSVPVAVAMVLLSAAGLWIASLVISAIRPELDADQWLLMDGLYYGPFMLLPVLIYALRREGAAEGLRLNPLPVLPTLTVVFAALMTVYAASAACSLWGMLLDAAGLHAPDAAEGLGAGPLTLAIIHSAAVPAVCEELLFRGAVFSAFESRGTRYGIWMSAALFALVHGNLYGMPAYLMFGAISGFMVFALDSLYAGMVFHTVYNSAILVINRMSADAADVPLPQGGALAAAVITDLIVVGLMMAGMLAALNLRRKAVGIEPVPRNRVKYRRVELALLILTFSALTFVLVLVQVLAG